MYLKIKEGKNFHQVPYKEIATHKQETGRSCESGLGSSD
jgi:hypothetical protein